jgi:hypothetical protein
MKNSSKRGARAHVLKAGLSVLAGFVILTAIAIGLYLKFAHHPVNSQSRFFENTTVVAGGSGDRPLWVLNPSDPSGQAARQVQLSEDVGVHSVAAGGGRVFVSAVRKDFYSDTKSGVYEVDIDSGKMSLLLDTNNQAARGIHEIIYAEHDGSGYLVAIGTSSIQIVDLSDGVVLQKLPHERQVSSWASLEKQHVFRFDRTGSSISLLELPSGAERVIASGVSEFIPSRSQSRIYFVQGGSWKFLDSSLTVNDARPRDLEWARDRRWAAVLVNRDGRLVSLLTGDVRRGTKFISEKRTIFTVDAGLFCADFVE